MRPINLDLARAMAAREIEHTGDEYEFRALVFDLCDEIEALRAAT